MVKGWNVNGRQVNRLRLQVCRGSTRVRYADPIRAAREIVSKTYACATARNCAAMWHHHSFTWTQRCLNVWTTSESLFRHSNNVGALCWSTLYQCALLTLSCKVKRQYLLTLQVSRYCLLALQSRFTRSPLLIVECCFNAYGWGVFGVPSLYFVYSAPNWSNAWGFYEHSNRWLDHYVQL